MGREKRVRVSEKELEIIKETKGNLSEDFPFLNDMALGSFVAWMCYEMNVRKRGREAAESLIKGVEETTFEKVSKEV